MGFISTRFHGIDGVSLETRKWAHVFESLGFETYFFQVFRDWYPERSMVIPEAFFNHPEILEIQDGCFGKNCTGRRVDRKIQAKRKILKEALYAFIRRWEIDLLVIENAVTIPINIPFGLAITEIIAETGIPTIAHHHDFVWERQRFSVSAVNDYITMAFPPDLPPLMHLP